jgi:hypothetical protein
MNFEKMSVKGGTVYIGSTVAGLHTELGRQAAALLDLSHEDALFRLRLRIC